MANGGRDLALCPWTQYGIVLDFKFSNIYCMIFVDVQCPSFALKRMIDVEDTSLVLPQYTVVT